MRYVLVTETFPPDVNGVAMTLERILQGLQQRGNEVSLVRPRPRRIYRRTARPIPYLSDDIQLTGFPIPFYSELQCGRPAYGTLLKQWAASPPDIVHVATEGPLGYTALQAARKLNLPVVSTFHTNFHSYGDHYGYGWFRRQVVAYGVNFHNKCDATLVPSEDVRQALEQQGIERTGLLARGVDTALFSPQRRTTLLRDQWGVGPDEPVVIYVGRIAAEKNIPLTIEAFLAFRENQPKAKFVLVGDGPERERLRKRFPEFHFAGMQHGEALAAHYASADLFFFASVTETFGNVVTEALASGLVVLAYDYAAAQKHIENGKSGVTCAFEDRDAFIACARELAAHPVSWPAMRQAARAKAETISWQKVIDTFEQQMRALIADKARP